MIYLEAYGLITRKRVEESNSLFLDIYRQTQMHPFFNQSKKFLKKNYKSKDHGRTTDRISFPVWGQNLDFHSISVGFLDRSKLYVQNLGLTLHWLTSSLINLQQFPLGQVIRMTDNWGSEYFIPEKVKCFHINHTHKI